MCVEVPNNGYFVNETRKSLNPVYWSENLGDMS